MDVNFGETINLWGQYIFSRCWRRSSIRDTIIMTFSETSQLDDFEKLRESD